MALAGLFRCDEACAASITGNAYFLPATIFTNGKKTDPLARYVS